MFVNTISPRQRRRIVARRVQQHIKDINSTSKITTQAINLSSSNSDVNLSNDCDSSDASSNDTDTNLSESSSTGQESKTSKNIIDLKDDLRVWAISNNITGIACQSLLDVLREYDSFRFLPKDQRSLLARKSSTVKREIQGGFYCHLGIKNKIVKHFNETQFVGSEPVLNLKLELSFDGLPISKSSNSQFWPIQGYLVDFPAMGVFVIGLYHGSTKPVDVHEYLADLIEELLALKSTGFNYRNVNVKVNVVKIIADAPARSFIKQCKNHNSYNGREKCTDKGIWSGRVIFKSLDSQARTDEGFRFQTDKNHHLGISPFTQIEFPLVSGVPLDYMHLVCLGVTRKILRAWVKGPIPYKLSNSNIFEISKVLCSFRSSCPKEFSRKPRSLKELDMWKASELRTFLLYTGPVALRNILPTVKYNHFMMLSVSIRILVSDKAKDLEWNAFCKRLLSKFVRDCSKLYSEDFLTYNMHSLIHIADDCSIHGNLDSFSAFKYENNMQFLKRSLRASYKPLEQCINRIEEIESVCKSVAKRSCVETLSTSPGNKYYRLKNGCIIKLCSVDVKSTTVLCKRFIKVSNFFTKPCESKTLGIITVSKLSAVYSVNVDEIERKCWLLALESNKFVSMPLCNSD